MRNILALWTVLLIGVNAASTLAASDKMHRADEADRYAKINSELAEWGILDITKRPYVADPTGERDATAVIQRAVNDGRDRRWVVFFPSGTYRVSDTILVRQIRQTERDNPRLAPVDDYPCVLWGATYGGRAKIVLADGAVGFDDAQQPKPVIRTDAHNGNPNVSFNQTIVSLDFDLGHGNFGAIAVDHQGAQGSVTEDVHVEARDGFAGFRGVCGSGGGTSHVSVRGGRFGLYLDGSSTYTYRGSQPSPVISAITLIGQTEKSIVCATRGPLTLVGASIDGPGIVLKPTQVVGNGALNFIDSTVRLSGDGPAITGSRPVYLNNVFFKDAEQIVGLESLRPLAGAKNRWTHVRRYAIGTSPQYPIWINGSKTKGPLSDIKHGCKPPPNALLERHRWSDSLPAWNDPSVANVRQAPFGATGDGETDDTDAIQRALDEHQSVFLPKGIYRISRSLRLKSDSRLFGLSVHSKIDPKGGEFADASNPAPLLIAPNDAKATCVAAFFQLWCSTNAAYAIHWQAGANSIVRNVRTKPLRGSRTGPATHPLILIEGHGGGRWYNATMHHKFDQGPDHRHVLVRGTRERLAFYMLNSEHSGADTMVEFNDVRNLDIFAVKTETLGAGGPKAMTPFLIRNSSDFRIFGHGGNGCPAAGEPMYRIENCSNFVLTNFGYQRFEACANPSTWPFVEEIGRDGQRTTTPGSECFVLYQRGAGDKASGL